MSSLHSLPNYVFKVHFLKGILQLNDIFVQLFVNVFAEKYSGCLHDFQCQVKPTLLNQIFTSDMRVVFF